MTRGITGQGRGSNFLAEPEVWEDEVCTIARTTFCNLNILDFIMPDARTSYSIVITVRYCTVRKFGEGFWRWELLYRTSNGLHYPDPHLSNTVANPGIRMNSHLFQPEVPLPFLGIEAEIMQKVSVIRWKENDCPISRDPRSILREEVLMRFARI